MAGRTNPQRRQHILDAAVRVIIDQGTNALSYRRVAKEADVPLTATSYYFGTIDQLLEAAFAQVVERDVAVTARRLGELPSGSDPIQAVARMIDDLITDRGSGVLALELYVAALRSERLRPLALEVEDAWYETLVPHFGADNARVVVAVINSLVMRGFMLEAPMTLQEIETVLHSGIGRESRPAEAPLPPSAD